MLCEFCGGQTIKKKVRKSIGSDNNSSSLMMSKPKSVKSAVSATTMPLHSM